MIAALFVETAGVYFGLPNVDPWDERRDARSYAGPLHVVAHPPCERWGRFAEGTPTKRGYTLGDDGGCFASALISIYRYGGVLEHPAGSKAWATFRLQIPPSGGGWQADYEAGHFRWVCQVEQGHYGHVARKSTWLLYVGNAPPQPLIWGRAPQRLPARRLAERGYESARRCGMVGNQSSQQRQRTPPQFRDLLLSIARSAQ